MNPVVNLGVITHAIVTKRKKKCRGFPYKVLLIRGAVRTDTVDGIAPEFAAMMMRVYGEEGGQARVEQMRPICPRMSRVFIQPAWVGILDFETRFPGALARAMGM